MLIGFFVDFQIFFSGREKPPACNRSRAVELRLLRLKLIGFQVLEPAALVGPISPIRQPDTSVWALKTGFCPYAAVVGWPTRNAEE